MVGGGGGGGGVVVDDEENENDGRVGDAPGQFPEAK
jgi:hypothetical protein